METPTTIACAVCGITLSSEEQYAEHVKGKKHQRQVDIFKHREEEAKRSLFVRLTDKTGNDKVTLQRAFQQYGTISRIIVDPNKASFAIIEFDHQDPVDNLLSMGTHLVLDGIKFKYQPRKVQLKPQTHRHGTQESGRKLRIRTSGVRPAAPAPATAPVASSSSSAPPSTQSSSTPADTSRARGVRE